MVILSAFSPQDCKLRRAHVERGQRQQTRLQPYHTPHTQTYSTGFWLLYFVALPQIKMSPLHLEDHISTINHSNYAFFRFRHFFSPAQKTAQPTNTVQSTTSHLISITSHLCLKGAEAQVNTIQEIDK